MRGSIQLKVGGSYKRNQLPPSVQEADPVTSFKSRLKTFLLDSAYS